MFATYPMVDSAPLSSLGNAGGAHRFNQPRGCPHPIPPFASCAQAEMRQHHHDPCARAAPYTIFTDGTSTHGRKKIQPFQWVPAWLSDDLAHKKGVMTTLAMLPCIPGTDIADAIE